MKLAFLGPFLKPHVSSAELIDNLFFKWHFKSLWWRWNFLLVHLLLECLKRCFVLLRSTTRARIIHFKLIVGVLHLNFTCGFTNFRFVRFIKSTSLEPFNSKFESTFDSLALHTLSIQCLSRKWRVIKFISFFLRAFHIAFSYISCQIYDFLKWFIYLLLSGWNEFVTKLVLTDVINLVNINNFIHLSLRNEFQMLLRWHFLLRCGLHFGY